MSMIKLGVLVGSLRKGSFSKSVADSLVRMLPKAFDPQYLSLDDLPLYNQDMDQSDETPSQWIEFRKQVAAMDAFLFVTPEYNRSIPPVLTNAVAIASRPPSHNAWGGKPGAIVSVSPGRTGGFGANHHLRQSLSCLDIYAMAQPEAYIGNISKALDSQGNIVDLSTQKLLQNIADGFAVWVHRFLS